MIDLNLSEKLPEGVRTMALILKKALAEGKLDPFRRKITAQDGSVKTDGSRSLPPDEILHMDWLCSNVIGSIPTVQELLPMSIPMVQELGIHREKIPMEKEGLGHEDINRIR